MNHLFLSDVHLGALSEKTERSVRHDLAELIRFCSKQEIMIHIHGDLFDYWMEYPNWKPEIGKDILKCFSDYMDKHGAINYVTGNHDNWTNGYFEKLGFNISHDFFDLSLGSKRIFLHHGDGLRFFSSITQKQILRKTVSTVTATKRWHNNNESIFEL